MAHQDPDSYRPTFSPRVRTAVYVGSLAVTTVAVVTLGILVVLGALELPRALAVLGVVTTATTYLAAGFGTAYRPASLS